MKTLVVVYSYHHLSTQKIAETMVKVLDAKVKTPQQTKPAELTNYSLVGLGAGIDIGRHYKQLLDFADQQSNADGKEVFIFSTSGVSKPKYQAKIHTPLREMMDAEDYVGEFNCHDFNTNSFPKYFGGINKGRPNEEDLRKAEEFAQNLKK